MIEQKKRNAVYQLHLEGIGIRKISRQLKISRNTVRTIIEQEGEMPETERSDSLPVDTQLLRSVPREKRPHINLNTGKNLPPLRRKNSGRSQRK